MYALGRDIVTELGLCAFALASTTITAGGGGDSAAINGATIDLAKLTGNVRAESIAFLIGASATLAQGKTLAVSARVLTSADGATWTEVVASTGVIALVGATGGSTETSTGKIGVALEYCQQYVRVEVKPDLSAANTDTATVFGLAVFGGQDRLP